MGSFEVKTGCMQFVFKGSIFIQSQVKLKKINGLCGTEGQTTGPQRVLVDCSLSNLSICFI